MAGYPDLRYQFIRGLIQHESWQRTRHYMKSAAECTSRAIVSLELAESPVKSVKQAQKLDGIGGETCRILRKINEDDVVIKDIPSQHKYTSSAGALLVALLNEELQEYETTKDHVSVPHDKLREEARNLSEETFLDPNVDIGFCQAWWRLEVLIKRGLVKKRSYHKSPVYHLLPEGREVAKRLKASSSLEKTSTVTSSSSIKMSPKKKSSNSTSILNETPSKSFLISPSKSHEVIKMAESSSVKSAEFPWKCQSIGDSLYTNDNGADGIIMLVDISEMGGERVGLDKLCDMLSTVGITYSAQCLPLADYSWRWRRDAIERLLPCIVERKRADDLARSLKEGRFWKQIQKMLDWKKKFTDIHIDCQLHYILEGKPQQYVVNCGDGCQGVGQCKFPNVAQVQKAIEDLKNHPDMNVQETDDVQSTVLILESITADLKHKIEKGELDYMKKLEISLMNNSVIEIDDSDNEDIVYTDTPQREDSDEDSPSLFQINEERSLSPVQNKLLMDDDVKCYDDPDWLPDLDLSQKTTSTIKLASQTRQKLSSSTLTRSLCRPTSSSILTNKNSGFMKTCPLELPNQQSDDPDWLPDLNLSQKTTSTIKLANHSRPKLSSSTLSRTPCRPTSSSTLTNRNSSVNGNKTYPSELAYQQTDLKCDSGPLKLNRKRGHSCDHLAINHISHSKQDDENSDLTYEPLVQYHNSFGFASKTPKKELKTGEYIPKINNEDIPNLIKRVSRSGTDVPKIDDDEVVLTKRDTQSSPSFSRKIPHDEIRSSSTKLCPETELKLSQISDVFPHLSRDLILPVLYRQDGDIERCIEEILENSH